MFACDFVICLLFKIINTYKEIGGTKKSNQIKGRNTILNDGKKILVCVLKMRTNKSFS